MLIGSYKPVKGLALLLAASASLALAACSSSDGGRKLDFISRLNADQGAPKVRFDPKARLSHGNYLNARLAASQHDMADAARFYRTSLTGDPANPDLIGRAFLYSASAGEVEQAARLAHDVIKHEPDNREARTTLAVLALKNGKYAEARTQLTQSASGPFIGLTVALLKSWALVGERNYDAALGELATLRSQGGNHSLEALQRAMILDMAGRSAEAEEAFKDALQKGGYGPRIVEAYGRFLERQGRKDDAKAFYDARSEDGALTPVLLEAKARLARGSRVEPLISSAQDGAAESLFGIAASLNDAAIVDASVLYLRYTLYLRPDHNLAHLLLAERLERQEKYDQAIAVYHSIPKSSPYRRIALVHAAINEARLERNDKAIKDLLEVVQNDKEDSEAWTALGDVYRAQKDYQKATEAYDEALRIRGDNDPNNWPLLYARAVSFEQSNRWPQAEADLKAALALNPEEPQVLNYLGYSWVDRGQHLDAALGMLEKARALRPFDGYIADSVGWAYYKLGRYEDAVTTLQSAVLLVPGDPTINDHYGDALWRVGRRIDARFQWNHALTFGAEGKDRASIETKLKDGLQGAAKS